MAKKKSSGKKIVAKKSARKVAVKAMAHPKTTLVAKPPVVIVAIEAEPKLSTAFAWARMPFAIMNMWLAPFERRT